MAHDRFYTFPFLFFLVVFVGTIAVALMMSRVGIGPAETVLRRLSPEQLLVNGYSDAVHTATQIVQNIMADTNDSIDINSSANVASTNAATRVDALKAAEVALLALAPPEAMRFAHLKLVRLSVLWRQAIEQKNTNETLRLEEEWEDLLFMITLARL